MNIKSKERYHRHLILPQVGEEGQQKLSGAKVLVVGSGGLGCPVLLYLVAAGIGRIGIVDKDVVSLSNLQRQVLFNEGQLGKSKVEKSKELLQKLNSDVALETFPVMLDGSNAHSIIENYDIVVGATDNFASRICIDQVTKELEKPFVHGSIEEFQGQVSVFNYNGGPSYSDLFPDRPEESSLPIGVMGALPGIIGSIMACEVIKIILHQGNILSGKLLVYDVLEAEFKKLEFA